MRIGFDAKRAFNNGTGLGNYSRFVIRSLTNLYPKNEYFLFTPTVKPEFGKFIPEAKNIHLITPETFLSKTFSAAWRSFSIADLVKQFQLDVFHGLSNELPTGMEKSIIRKVVTIHDLIFLRYPNYYSNIDRYIYTKKFKHACERADIVLAASEQTKQDLITYFQINPSKVEVAYQNCDERFSISADGKTKEEVIKQYALPAVFILCVGTIEQRKDQLTVLKAFHQLTKKDSKLVFIGKQTNYAKELHEFIHHHKLEDSVLFLSEVEQSHLPAIYQLARLFVYASEFEGFGIPVLEGLRSKVPVIIANTSSLPEVGGDAVAYFKFGDAIELSEKMRVLITEEEMRQQMIEKGLQQAQKFDTAILCEQLLKFYSA
jgi:glycosyltransferase involved in cell wall biosynthesis